MIRNQYNHVPHSAHRKATQKLRTASPTRLSENARGQLLADSLKVIINRAKIVRQTDNERPMTLKMNHSRSEYDISNFILAGEEIISCSKPMIVRSVSSRRRSVTFEAPEPRFWRHMAVLNRYSGFTNSE